jgi:hypothetical protein
MFGNSFQNLVLLKCDILAEPKNQGFSIPFFPLDVFIYAWREEKLNFISKSHHFRKL